LRLPLSAYGTAGGSLANATAESVRRAELLLCGMLGNRGPARTPLAGESARSRLAEARRSSAGNNAGGVSCDPAAAGGAAPIGMAADVGSTLDTIAGGDEFLSARDASADATRRAAGSAGFHAVSTGAVAGCTASRASDASGLPWAIPSRTANSAPKIFNKSASTPKPSFASLPMVKPPAQRLR
jgi:hypothetical protein